MLVLPEEEPMSRFSNLSKKGLMLSKVMRVKVTAIGFHASGFRWGVKFFPCELMALETRAL